MNRVIDSRKIIFDNQYKESYVISSTNHTISNSYHLVILQKGKIYYSCNLFNLGRDSLPQKYSKMLPVTNEKEKDIKDSQN